MSIQERPAADAPELTPLGAQLELLRIRRGVSKQHLAQFAGVSRQQLWRIVTGKSELTPSVAQRLTSALGAPIGTTSGARHDVPMLAMLLLDASERARVEALLPDGLEGRRLRRALSDIAEEVAIAVGEPMQVAHHMHRRTSHPVEADGADGQRHRVSSRSR